MNEHPGHAIELGAIPLSAEFAAVLEQLFEGVVVTDAQGRISFVNEAAARLHGIAPDEVARADYARAFSLLSENGQPYPPDEHPLARAVCGETVVDVRWRIRRPDGSEIVAIGSARPLTSAGGVRTGAVLTLRQDTDRAKAEEALRASEATLRAFFETDGLFASVMELAGDEVVYVAANRSFARLFGREDVAGMTARQLMGRTVAGRLAERLRAIHVDGEAITLEHPADLPSGRRWFSATICPIARSADGRPRFTTASLEITDRRTAEQRLSESEERTRLAMSGARLGAWDWDLTAGRGWWSARTCEIMGVADGENLTPKDREERVHPDDRAMVQAAVAAAVRDNGDFALDYRVVRPDGDVRFVSSRGLGARHGDGRVRVTGVVQDVTEERAARAALAESEARLRALADNLPAAVVYQVETSRDMAERRYTFVSANCERLTGVPSDRVLADPTLLLSMIDPHELERVLEAEQATARELTTLDIEMSGRTADGRSMIARTISRPREVAGGRLLWDGLLLDITQQREADARLRESEARFRLIADSAPVPMWVTRIDRKREFVNRAYVDFLGISYEAAVDYDWRDRVHPDDAERLVAESIAGEASLKPFGLEARYRDAAGRWRWLRSESRPRFGPGGEHVGFIGVAYDVTPAREAEARLRESEAKFRTIANAMPQMVWSTRPDGYHDFYNDRWYEFTGASPGSTDGEAWNGMFHADDRDRARQLWTRSLATGEPYEIEYRLRHRSGHYRWTLGRALPVRDEAGRIIRWMGTCTDIQELVEAREGAARAAEELERRVREAIAERAAAMAQLHEVQKLETIGQLSGGVAHDFNNLLTPVMGSLDLLRRRVDDERSQRLIAGALTATERARTLVSRLLSFARRQHLEPRAVDPAALLDTVRELVDRSLGPTIDVAIEAADDVPPALVDPNQLELALLNLAVNARDAMPGGGRLTIAAAAEDVGAGPGLKAGSYVRFTVADTGIGMDEATLARAIEPFFSTKDVGKGTGLGLSMVHGLAAQSGGGFHLASRPGAGTTATLWLPVATRAAEASGHDPSITPAPRRATLLLVDDEAMVRTSVGEGLRDLGYDVVETASAAQALASIRDGLRPDLVVTDQLMPSMTGTQLADELATVLAHVPVLLISGYADISPAHAGRLERLAKPFRQSELAAKVAAMLVSGIPAGS
jgi:PAS domain S-box-containing protein